MKSKAWLKIEFQDLNDFKHEVKRALSTRKSLLQPKNQIVFDSVATYRKFMTIQKIEVLTAIANQQPSSIYELAKVVDRDFAAVLRDCASLEGAGFIKLRKTGDSKKSKAPTLSFPYIGLAIHLPKRSYQIEFELAA